MDSSAFFKKVTHIRVFDCPCCRHPRPKKRHLPLRRAAKRGERQRARREMAKEASDG